MKTERNPIDSEINPEYLEELNKSKTYRLSNVLIARREDKYPTKKDTQQWVPWHEVCAQVILASSNKDSNSKNKDNYPGYYKLRVNGVIEYGIISHVQYSVDGESKIVHIRDYTNSNLKPIEGRNLIDSLALKV